MQSLGQTLRFLIPVLVLKISPVFGIGVGMRLSRYRLAPGLISALWGWTSFDPGWRWWSGERFHLVVFCGRQVRLRSTCQAIRAQNFWCVAHELVAPRTLARRLHFSSLLGSLAIGRWPSHTSVAAEHVTATDETGDGTGDESSDETCQGSCKKSCQESRKSRSRWCASCACLMFWYSVSHG